MKLSELYIENFRKIKEIIVSFPAGLSVIVGENNCGKTAIIDALRFMLHSPNDYGSIKITEEDFKKDTNYLPIEFSCTFTELSEEEEVHFFDYSLFNIGEESSKLKINARITYNSLTGKINYDKWAGEAEDGTRVDSAFYDRFEVVYLQPLRDPKTGMNPGKHSRLSRLLQAITEEEKYNDFVEVIKSANEEVGKLEPIKDAEKIFNDNLEQITGKELSQEIKLIFSDPNFLNIIADLQPEIDKLSYSLNGLGYNNILFVAATLGIMKGNEQFSFRSILIEEPEAHLHPQLQTLFIRHLEKISKDAKIQVIATSHSPVMVSQAPLDTIISVFENDDGVNSLTLANINYDESMKRKLQRFLDATRAELFFARRLLMVEGIAEALLIPVLTKCVGVDLKESSVTVLNVNGLNFNAFIELFGRGKLNFPTAILTDSDREKDDELSANAEYLKTRAGNIENLEVYIAQQTFEYELALSPNIFSFMIESLEKMHPTITKKFKEDIDSIDSDTEKAKKFIELFVTKKVSKGIFAQELADILSDQQFTYDDVPRYIVDALIHLGINNSES